MSFKKLNQQIQHCCLSVSSCGKCSEGNCCINYCKEVINLYDKKKLRLIPNGMGSIPKFDVKVYHNSEIIACISECLLLCKQCNHNHMKECVINVVRSSLERIIFGDNIDDYKGSVLQHIIELTKLDSEMGTSVANYYNHVKKK